MFDYLVEANGLRPVMEEHGLVLPEDLDFIKEQIAGPLDTIAAKGKKVPISYSCIFVYVYLHAGVCVCNALLYHHRWNCVFMLRLLLEFLYIGHIRLQCRLKV